MCGIAGVYRAHPAADDRKVVQTMLDRLRFRGPDGEGIVSEGPLCLPSPPGHLGSLGSREPAHGFSERPVPDKFQR